MKNNTYFNIWKAKDVVINDQNETNKLNLNTNTMKLNEEIKGMRFSIARGTTNDDHHHIYVYLVNGDTYSWEDPRCVQKFIWENELVFLNDMPPTPEDLKALATFTIANTTTNTDLVKPFRAKNGRADEVVIETRGKNADSFYYRRNGDTTKVAVDESTWPVNAKNPKLLLVKGEEIMIRIGKNKSYLLTSTGVEEVNNNHWDD